MKFDEDTVIDAGSRCYKIINGTLDESACDRCPYHDAGDCRKSLINDLMEAVGSLLEQIRKPKLRLGMVLANIANDEQVIIRTTTTEYEEEMITNADSWFAKQYEDCAVETVGVENGRTCIYIEVKE